MSRRGSFTLAATTLLLAPLLAGCLGAGTGPEAPLSEQAGDAAAPGPQAVVALLDTGINPYHLTFRDDSPLAYEYPGTYIPAYPSDAVALHLTLNASSWEEAVKADCEAVWSKVEPRKLYWFPGTKIIGAIAFDDLGTMDCSADPARQSVNVLDDGGHGTMTASRAGSFEYGACKECRIVAVQTGLYLGSDVISAIDWMTAQATWIDVQSHSWGPFVPAPAPLLGATPFRLVGSQGALVRAVEAASQAHPAFWASGNGALFRFGVVGHPTLLSPHLTPSAISVGGHDSGYVNAWPGFPPHVVSDSCNSWAAYHQEMEKSADSVGGGTSGATPYAAGGAAAILLEARRSLGDTGTGVREGGALALGTPAALPAKGPLSDGVLTVEELKDLVKKTASTRPERQYEDGAVCKPEENFVIYGSTPVAWKDVPAAYPEFLHIGYGAVDNRSMALALEVLHGSADQPDRSRTDQYFALDAQARKATYPVWSAIP